MRIPTVDIPQANTLALVGDLIALMNAGVKGNSRLAAQIGIDPRQIEYYKHAARILGFAAHRRGTLVLTDRGRAYLQAKRPAEKFALMSEAVRDTRVFKELLNRHTEAELSKANIMAFLRRGTGLTGTTLGRRADSITAWLKTISKFDPEDFASLAEHATKRAEEYFRHYRKVEEGFLHRRLKTAISERPHLLGEQLTLIQLEYQFPTNDRADILFLDAKARFLAVEVEVDVGPLDVVGLLQAVKYKAMLAVQFGRMPSSIRGMLAARTIHPVMQERAQRYDIETRQIKDLA